LLDENRFLQAGKGRKNTKEKNRAVLYEVVRSHGRLRLKSNKKKYTTKFWVVLYM
jgi:hypothetical protein